MTSQSAINGSSESLHKLNVPLARYSQWPEKYGPRYWQCTVITEPSFITITNDSATYTRVPRRNSADFLKASPSRQISQHPQWQREWRKGTLAKNGKPASEPTHDVIHLKHERGGVEWLGRRSQSFQKTTVYQHVLGHMYNSLTERGIRSSNVCPSSVFPV